MIATKYHKSLQQRTEIIEVPLYINTAGETTAGRIRLAYYLIESGKPIVYETFWVKDGVATEAEHLWDYIGADQYRALNDLMKRDWSAKNE